MGKIRLLILIFFTVWLGACAHLPSNAPDKKDLSLIDAESLRPGKLNMANLLEKLGMPDLTVPIKDSSLDAIAYFMSDKSATRISFLVDRVTGQVIKTVWFTQPGELETKLSAVLQRYSDAHFIKSRVPWTAGDAAPSIDLYEDLKRGLIVEQEYGRYIRSITFQVPSEPQVAKKQ